ncbi:MAG TPA: 3-oxoadipate enol-lactonase [Pseudonocardiaceae bacterium]|nr:3-oxoadipate enol-lactonase [Pseudonocardiaceae bacterium]
MKKSVDVHYELTGPADAPVLVLAGPLGTTLDIWDPQVEALSEQFRMLRYDHRGHGGSPVPTGPYSMEDLTVDVVTLLDRLEIEQAAFCGLSLGGMVGIWLAAHAHDRVSSLVLCSTSAQFGDPQPWHERGSVVRWAGTVSIADEVVERWFTPDWAAKNPEQVERAKQMIANTNDEGYASCCTAIAALQGLRLLGRILAPTLVIAGKQDPAIPVNPHAEILANGIAGAKLKVLDAAHVVTVEQADTVNDLIAQHITAG